MPREGWKEIQLKDHDPSWAGDTELSKRIARTFAEKMLSEDVDFAGRSAGLCCTHPTTWSILVVLQAMDAAGKDGIIKHVMSGVNPQGCQISTVSSSRREAS